MPLGEVGGGSFEAEQCLIAAEAAGQCRHRLPEERVPFAGLGLQLRLQCGGPAPGTDGVTRVM